MRIHACACHVCVHGAEGGGKGKRGGKRRTRGAAAAEGKAPDKGEDTGLFNSQRYAAEVARRTEARQDIKSMHKGLLLAESGEQQGCGCGCGWSCVWL